MNHIQIAYFLAVANYRSFSEASRQLFVAQSAISKQIQALESKLGMKLFIRSARNVDLTPAGEILYRELQKYNDWLLNIINMAKQVDQGKAGVLNFGVLHGLDLSGSDINFFYEFFERYPGIQLNIHRLGLKDSMQSLYMGTQDVLITFSFLCTDIYDVEQVVIKEEIDKIIVAKAHPLGKIKKVTPKNLREFPLVTISPEVSRYAYLNSLNHLKGLGVSPQKIIHVPTIEDILLSVEFGLGYGVASETSRLKHCKESIVFLDFYDIAKMPPPKTNIIAIWDKENHNPSMQFFIEHLKKFTRPRLRV